jgi:hypothetical protein
MEDEQMAQVAFALKENAEPEQAGTVFVHDGLTINVREALEEGNGYIVTEDEAAIRVLNDYAPIKRVQVSEAEEGRKKKAAAKSEKAESGKAGQKESRS